MTQPSIRTGRLTREDLDDVGALFHRHTGRPADLDIIGAWIDGWPCVGAWTGGPLAGFLLCKSFAPDVGEIANLLVAPELRDRGIGGALLACAESLAVEQGITGMVGVTSIAYDVVGPKRLASPFYVRHGYRVVLETAHTHVFARTLGETAA
ncbi:MAG: GNAT family N-acetyltransferase [Acidimicrobiales bacterium]|nr:GNAT family N-acetyltransferase [Acidimicrobiales bacterium]